MAWQVAERTQADKKGGHLARRLKDQRLVLRESAMCLDEDKAAFEDVSKHCFFNTNNLWVNLDDLKCADCSSRSKQLPSKLPGAHFDDSVCQAGVATCQCHASARQNAGLSRCWGEWTDKCGGASNTCSMLLSTML